MKVIARIHTDFPTKFSIPRQSGIVDTKAKIVFEPEYKDPQALRGLEGFSHIWILWEFSEVKRGTWSPTVRPPRLGGNERMGVFATRSPFRPNPIGLSSVAIDKIDLDTPEGPVIYVTGADLMDGTPIYDIKPYIPYTDCHEDAVGGFAKEAPKGVLEVIVPEEYERIMPDEKLIILKEILALDPRPSYQDEKDRVYGFPFSDYEVKFKVDGGKLIVTGISKNKPKNLGGIK